MKVISGFLKGRNILGFNIEGTRPTMDRVKESLFSMIQNYIDKATVLDLFSGSGNLAIEAISNGALSAYLVDNNKKCIDIINKNLINFDILDKSKVLYLDYKKALNYLRDNSIKFDVIFLDPPYENKSIPNIMEFIMSNKLLNKNGIIVCEVTNYDLIKEYNDLVILKNKKYGDKYIVIYKYEGDGFE